MKKILLSLTCMVVILLAGCGGGGGEAGNDSSSELTYSGNTSEAVIDSDNALELTAAAYQGGSFGSTMDLIGSVKAENTDPVSPLPIILSNSLKDTLDKINGEDPSSQNLFANTAKSASVSIPGICGGSASYSIIYNDQTGYFSGSLAFNDYCTLDGTLSGSTAISGQINLTTGRFITVTLALNSLSATSGSERITIKGSMHFSYTSSSFTVTYNAVVKDNMSNKIYWWSNLAVGITDGSGYKDLSMAGRIYHPGYGYVTVSTPTLLRFYDLSATPSSGILLLTGKTGTAGGNTSAHLTVLSNINYMVQADTDGDGAYDWESGTLYW